MKNVLATAALSTFASAQYGDQIGWGSLGRAVNNQVTNGNNSCCPRQCGNF